MNKKNINNRGFLWIVIFVCFALAVLDMSLLRDVLMKFNIGGGDDVMPSIIAFALATAANLSALVWGMQVGQRKSGKSFFWGWVMLGFVYALFRGIKAWLTFTEAGSLDTEELSSEIVGQIVIAAVLTISYIGTGTMIKWAAEQLWDTDVVNYLTAKRKFEAENKLLAKNSAMIDGMIKKLQEYDGNYEKLDEQYNGIKDTIRKIEASTMDQIVEKTIVKNPEISPVAARQVMENVLVERDKENEKLHDKK